VIYSAELSVYVTTCF